MERADVRDVAAAFVAADPDLTALKLQKLVYYTQAWHLAEHGHPAFDDEIQAWKEGPVVRRIYDLHQGRRRVAGLIEGTGRPLPPSVLEIVSTVWLRYGHLSADELSRITHRERPWREAREGLPPEARSERALDAEVMRAFYRRQGGGRRSAVDDVLASARLEGYEPSDQDRTRLEAIAGGRLTADQAVDEIVQAYRA